MHPAHRTLHHVHRISTGILILVTIAAMGIQFMGRTQRVFADQVTSRFIKMSESSASALNVSYLASFGISTSYSGNMKSYIIDFCAQSPLPTDNCTTPAGLDLSAATPIGGNTAGWTITTSNSQIKVSDATGIAGGSTVSLELSGITNPSAVGGFYARVYTFDDATFGTYADPINPGNYVDYGGMALSTAESVALTAFVQEEITFCISGDPIGNGCTGLTPPSMTIGHGLPPIVDGTQVDIGSAYMQTSSNASAGVAVRMKNDNSCAGLSSDGGATCPLPPAGNSPVSFSAGTADFGMNVAPSIGGLGFMNPFPPYDQHGANKYAMSPAVGSGVTSTYGSIIADSGSGSSNVNNTLTFAAAASNITAADTYHARMTMIATGTF